MAQKIYNNGSDGKILMSSAGKVIRQPYDFGNAFQNRMGLNNYIKITGLNFSSKSYSVLDWHNQRGVISQNGGNMFQSSDNYIDQLHIRSGNTEVSQSQTAFMGMSNNYSLKLYAIIAEQTVLTTYRNYTKYILDTTNIQQKQFSNVFLGARNSNISSATSANIDTFSGINYAYSTIILYDRIISYDEILFFHANGLGNDPRTLYGSIFYFRRDKAEILNTGGADFVGVRDYSGNNHHGQIMNLPPGDIYTQLAYANANLFVPFLT